MVKMSKTWNGFSVASQKFRQGVIVDNAEVQFTHLQHNLPSYHVSEKIAAAHHLVIIV